LITAYGKCCEMALSEQKIQNDEKRESDENWQNVYQ